MTTSPCEAWEDDDPAQMRENIRKIIHQVRENIRNLVDDLNYERRKNEKSDALLAEKDRTIAELRDLVSEEITRSRSKTWLRRAESILARKKEKSPSESTPGAGKGDRT